MKVLLDENLDHRLRKSLDSHEVFTVSYMGWAGLKNGDLLLAAEENGIEVFVTGDQALLYQQNLTGRQLAILALSAVEWSILKNNLAVIAAAVEKTVPGSFSTVQCGTFSRKRRRQD